MNIRKIFASILVSIFTVLPAINLFAVNAEDEDNENIIISSDFDDENIGKWTGFAGGTLSLDKENAHSGDTSLKITERNATYCGPSMTCDDLFIAGETYDFDGWVYNYSDSVQTFSWTIKYRNTYGDEEYAQISGKDIEPGVWTELSNTVVMNEDAVAFFIYFECSDQTVDFSIDDVSVKGYSMIQAKTENIEYLDEYSMGMEKDVEQWVSRGDVVISRTDEYSQSGSYSLFASNRTKVWNGPTMNISEIVKKGESYYYSAYIMYTGDEYEDSHGYRMELQYTLNGTVTYHLITEMKVKKDKWTKIEGYYTIPEDVDNIMLYIQTSNIEEDAEPTDNDLMSFYIDNVTIAKASVIKKHNTIMFAIIVGSSIILLAVIFLVGLLIFRKVKENNKALELVYMDAMTQVHNRNSYEKKIDELKNDNEKCKEYYYALCDVNFLKYINDNHGHEYGDEAIIRCAKMLKKIVGAAGDVYRTGGDEFVCISTKPLKDSVLQACEAESKIDMGYPFRIACGFAQYDSKLCPDITAIIAKCDKEMYIHKQKIKAENEKLSRK